MRGIECYALADQIYVRSAAEVRERTHATLERFIIMDDVTLVDRSMEDGSIALEGPRAGEVIAKLCGAPAGYASVGEMPEFATAAVSINTHHCRLIRRSHFGSNGFELLSPRAALPALWQGLRDAAQACGGGPVGYAALEALRGSELIVHAGDVGKPEILAALRQLAPVIAVKGNIDKGPLAAALPATAMVEAGPATIYVLHDIQELDLDPAAVRQGHDPQLEKTVAVLLAELEKHPIPAAKKPPYPKYQIGQPPQSK